MWWVVQRRGKTGKNRKWKTTSVYSKRKDARTVRSLVKSWGRTDTNFDYRIRKAKIVVEN